MNVPSGQFETVDGRTFGPGEIVTMDNRLFQNCVFDDCTLVYAGGGFGWDDSNDFRPRGIRLFGPIIPLYIFLDKFRIIHADPDLKIELEVPSEWKEIVRKLQDELPEALPLDDSGQSH